MYDAPETRLSLLLRLGDLNDDMAWREFLDIYQPLVLKLAQRHGLQAADAHDLVQDLFGRIAKKARAWQTDSSSGTFRGWLAITTRNLVIDHFRKAARRPTALTDSGLVRVAQPNIDEQFDLQQRRTLFQWAANRCRNEFTAKTWDAFWFSSVEHQPIAQVAEQLAMSHGAVYIARSRVLARIRALIERSNFDSCSLGEFA